MGRKVKYFYRNGLFVFAGSLVFIFVLSACKKETLPSQSFYYWRTVFRLNPYEREILTGNAVDRLYIRFFDVISGSGVPVPESTILFKDSIPADIQIIPVVFIVNDVLTDLPSDSIGILAKRIYRRIRSIGSTCPDNGMPEIQLDCDWTASTREKYFHLLQIIMEDCRKDSKQLSVTLRLHQMKYRVRSGIPPVDKAVLMCYNMGNMTEHGNKNSIIDAAEVRRYLAGSGLYPLPIDIALPLFNWGVRFRNGQYRGLINGLNSADMRETHFSEIMPRLYRADSAVFLRGRHIAKGEHIRVEEASPKEIAGVLNVLASELQQPKYIIWYHLDSLLLQKYSHNELQNLTRLFR
jgi:hypothetical protein